MAAANADFLSKVARTISRHGLLHPGDRVLAAVSGGADSVALVHALQVLGYELAIAHFDHQTRQGESALDARFVEDLAASMGLPFHGTSCAVAEQAAQTGDSFEMQARKLRYSFFEACAVREQYDVIATGHHAEDQAETVLMRLIRGAGPSGSAGIPFSRALGGLRVVRPLLEVSREDLRAWLVESGLSWREDASNADARHERNRIRHELIPLLEARYNPRVRAALCRFAAIEQMDEEYLEHHAAEAFASMVRKDRLPDRKAFNALPHAMQHRCVLRWAWTHRVEPGFERVVAAVEFIREAPCGRYLDLGEGAYLYSGREQVLFVTHRGEETPEGSVPLGVPSHVETLSHVFRTRLLDTPPEDVRGYCTPHRQVFDAARVEGPLTIRARHPGDTFAPLGLGGKMKLKEYFINVGIPEPMRDRHPLVSAGDTVLWVVGHAVSAHAAVTETTRECIEIEVADAAE